jgi:hypothetical protein
MEKPTERRSPERQPHTMALLRRLSASALALAAVILIAPRVLDYLGLIGPSAETRIAEAERAVKTAESYGATADAPAMAAAHRELQEARRLKAAGDERGGRAAALRAVARASEAQAAALTAEGQARLRARRVVEELDEQVNQLEHLYEEVSPKLSRQTRSALLKQMRATRKSAATVFLAHDEQRWDDALAAEDEARRALAGTRAALKAAGAVSESERNGAGDGTVPVRER